MHFGKQPDTRGKRPGLPVSVLGLLTIVASCKLEGALGTEQCFILVVEGAFREFFFVQSRVYGFNQDEFKRELRTRDITQVEASLLNEGDEQKVLDMRQFLPFNS